MPLINLCICILSVVKIERYTQSIRYPLHFLVLVKSCYQLIFIPGDYKENNNVSGIVIQYLLTYFSKIFQDRILVILMMQNGNTL